MQIQATLLRPGMVINYNNVLHSVVQAHHHTPGNLRGMMQVKLRNLKSGNSNEVRFRSEDKVEKITLDQQQLEYLYADGDLHYFMNTENFEQFPLTAELLGDNVQYLLPNTLFDVTFHEGVPVAVEPPKSMVMTIVKTDPTIKGATVTASKKPATLETGLVVQVPQFIDVGAKIKIDTRENTYLDRA